MLQICVRLSTRPLCSQLTFAHRQNPQTPPPTAYPTIISTSPDHICISICKQNIHLHIISPWSAHLPICPSAVDIFQDLPLNLNCSVVVSILSSPLESPVPPIFLSSLGYDQPQDILLGIPNRLLSLPKLVASL
jgi:hypothetical protein